MAKNVLPVDFQDDILSEDMDGRRKYQMITNADGTVSFVDVTEYTQVGSNFGQAQINATNEAVNESADKNKIIDTKADLMANTQAGMIAGASAVKAAVSELTEKTTMSWYGTGDDAVLTTKVWSQADDGFSYDVPTTGWYYLCARFTKNTSSSDYTGDMQLQLKSRTNGSLASTTISKLNSMSVYEVSKIARLVKGDKIFANVHTAQDGIKFNTGLFAVLLRTI